MPRWPGILVGAVVGLTSSVTAQALGAPWWMHITVVLVNSAAAGMDARYEPGG
jgi:ABC-type uncharacterized transport system permease subunit